MRFFLAVLALVGLTAMSAELDLTKACHEMVQRECGEKQWAADLKEAEERIGDRSTQAWLDDTLKNLALAAKSGNEDDVRELVCHLALYHHYGLGLPESVRTRIAEHEAEIQQVIASRPSWAVLAAAVRDKLQEKKAEPKPQPEPARLPPEGLGAPKTGYRWVAKERLHFS